MADCLHEKTTPRDSEPGIFCRDCGEKLYELEPRECQYCVSFRPTLPLNTCHKKTEPVFRSMHALFKVGEGTCFEANKSD